VPTGSPAIEKTIGNPLCRSLCRDDCGGPARDNDINLESDELGRDFSEAFSAPIAPAILDRDGAALDPAKFAQPPHESGSPWALSRRRSRAQEPDGRQLGRLLRPRPNGPRRRRADEMSDKFTPPHTNMPAYSPFCASAVAADSQDLLAISQLLCRGIMKSYSILLSTFDCMDHFCD
jgi:hypothetical protein